MRKEFTMTSTTHRCECSAASAILYVSFEMGAKEWLLTMGVRPDSKRQRTRLRPGDGAQLKQALDAAKQRFGLSPEAPVRSCYEAGRDGFWPHRWLDQVGVMNLVVDSSSIEVSRRARPAKSDRLDGEKLLRMLFRYWGGERDVWHTVRVPTREAEDERHASRRLTTLQQERTRFRNRIHSLLMLHGVAGLRIDEKFPTRIRLARDWAGQLLPPGVQARVLETWRLLQAVETQRRALRRAERERVAAARTPASAMAQRLTKLRGIAVRAATVLGDELFTRELRNRREVGGLTGYVSAPYNSGGDASRSRAHP
jgi:transposase